MKLPINKELFTYERITLTFWYYLVITIIVVLFSTGLFYIESKSIENVVLNRDFNNTIPINLSTTEKTLALLQVQDLKSTFLKTLIIANIYILSLSLIICYFIAGRTLKSIEMAVKQQKDFLADVSHEFRTPLSAMQIASEVVLRSKEKTLEDYKKVVEQNYIEIQRLGKIANGLLTLSRIDAGIVNTFTDINFTKLLTNVIDEMNLIAEDKEIKIIKHIQKHIFMKGDEDKLKQMLIIFLDNALKYTPRLGSITITLKQESWITLRITDTGRGIEERYKDKIFERFFRTNPENKDGIGLGLCIAKSIIDRHNGLVYVESKLGSGTTFEVRF